MSFSRWRASLPLCLGKWQKAVALAATAGSPPPGPLSTTGRFGARPLEQALVMYERRDGEEGDVVLPHLSSFQPAEGKASTGGCGLSSGCPLTLGEVGACLWRPAALIGDLVTAPSPEGLRGWGSGPCPWEAPVGGESMQALPCSSSLGDREITLIVSPSLPALPLWWGLVNTCEVSGLNLTPSRVSSVHLRPIPMRGSGLDVVYLFIATIGFGTQ